MGILTIIKSWLGGPTPTSTAGDVRASKGRILIVDDDPHIVELLCDFLARKGYMISVAVDGEEALTQIKKERPHLVLLDVMMPKMSGLEVLKRVKSIDGQVAVIMITAISDTAVAKKCVELGAVDYVVKPFNFEYLDASIQAQMLLRTN